MPSMPSPGVIGRIAFVAITIAAGLWIGGEYRERQRLLSNLKAHAKAFPNDKEIVQVLVECNERLVVDIEGCGAKLVEKYGPEVMGRLAFMADQGAFGKMQPGDLPAK